MSTWICPVCQSSSKSDGSPLTSPWSCALHIASKALTEPYPRRHLIWSQKINPDIDPRRKNPHWKNNKIATEILQAVNDSQPKQAAASGTSRSPKAAVGQLRTEAESLLKNFVVNGLQRRFGPGNWAESIWWTDGVPTNVRADLVRRRELAKSMESPLAWGHPVEFLEIITSSLAWPIFEPPLKGAGFRDQRAFRDQLVKFNEIGNLTHGAREKEPSTEDVQFARDFVDMLNTASK